MALRRKAANTDRAFEFHEKYIEPLEEAHSREELNNPNTALGKKYDALLTEHRLISLDLQWERVKSHQDAKAKKKSKDKNNDMDMG